MTDFKYGSYVKWLVKSGPETTIRAGRVLAMVPAYVHPNSLGFGEVVNKVLSPRSDDSYLILLPKWNAVMWPMVQHLMPLEESEKGVLTMQNKPPLTAKIIINRYDRTILVALAMNYGDECVSTSNDLTIENWGKRFEFAVADGVEYIKNVYTFEIDRS